MPETTVNISSGERVFAISVLGPLTAGDVVDILEKHYSEIGDRQILWDLMQADLSWLAEEHFGDIARNAATKLKPRTLRKTAYAVGRPSDYAIILRYLNAAFSARVPAEYAVFTNVDVARQWLMRQ